MIFSILIAAYNVEEFIKKCIYSCYNKRYSLQYEIIVVNDGSIDDTRSIVEASLFEIPNLKIINKQNEGLGAARNTGIEHAEGKYIWMIDGDDYLEPEAIDIIFNKILMSDSDIHAFSYQLINETSILSQNLNEDRVNLDPSEYYAKNFKLSYTFQFIFKKRLFTEHSLTFKSRINMQDSEILPKIIFFSKSISTYGDVLYNYVQQANSFTNSANGVKRLKYFESVIFVRNSLQEFRDEIKSKNILLAEAIDNKIYSLNGVVLNHLIFFKYETKTYKEIIILLKKHGFYPLKFESNNYKINVMKYFLNFNPNLARIIIDFLR